MKILTNYDMLCILLREEEPIVCTQLQLKQIADEVRRNMQNVFGNKLHKIILYGSYARGDYDNESDIDIMVLADMSEIELKNYRKQVNRIASKIGLNHDIMITITLKDKQSFDSHQELSPFYRNVANEGVSIYVN